MKLNFKISSLHFLVGVVTLLFTYMIYDSYIQTQKKDIEKKLEKVLNLNKQHMEKSLSNIEKTLNSKKDLTKKIHLSIHKILKKNQNLTLDKIKTKMKNDFNLESQQLDLEIFLIDSKYKTTKSTNSKNISRDLATISKGKESLDSLKNKNQFVYSKEIGVDFLQYSIKSYSYSKLDKSSFLGLALIYKNAIDEKKDFDEMREIANTHLDLFIVMKDKTGDQYYETLVSHRKDFDSFEEYLKSKEKFPVYKKTEDMVIQTARNWTVQNFKSNNTLSVYIPLMKKDNPIISIPGDIILQIDLDISEQNLFTQSVITKLAIFIFIHFLMIFLIFYFTIKYQKIQKKLEKENEKNKDLALYNKSFISNMVHQIRTPFSIVMTSTSLLEMFSKKDISKYTSQINVAINSLSNAYENLSYYISSKDLDYPKTQISFSKFLQDRVKFFGQISTVNGKEIITQIESDIELGFNNMELERLLDNNISNCIKFSDFGSKILITFKQTEKKNGLLFQFDSKNFAFNKKLFQDRKDLKLDNSSNTALGVYVIKKICDKYSIDYSLKVEKQRVTFSYYWI